jgi:hypothetical protein
MAVVPGKFSGALTTNACRDGRAAGRTAQPLRAAGAKKPLASFGEFIERPDSGFGGQDIRRTRFDLHLDLVMKLLLATGTETLRSAKGARAAALDDRSLVDLVPTTP